MADIKKTIEIESKGFRELQVELKRTKDLLAETSDPKELAKLSQQAADLKSEMEDLNDEVKAFQGSKFEQVSGQFGRVGTSIKNLDFAKAATQAKTLATMTQSISFKEVISGAKNFGKTLLNLGKAILANPLFLLAAVVTAIVFAIYKWMEATGGIQVVMDALSSALDAVIGWIMDGVNWIGDMVDKFDQLGTGVKIVIGIFAGPFMLAIYAVTKALKFFGIIEDEQTRKSKRLAREKFEAVQEQTKIIVDELNKQKIANLELNEVIQDSLDWEIRKRRAMGKEYRDLEGKKMKAAYESAKTQIALTNEIIEAKQKELLYASGMSALWIEGELEDLKIQKEENAKMLDEKLKNLQIFNLETRTINQKAKEQEKAEEDAENKRKRDIAKENAIKKKEQSDTEIAEAKRVRDELIKILTEQVADAESIYDKYNERRLNQEQREIENLRKREEDELNILITAKDAEVALQKLRLDEGLISIEKFEQEKLRIEGDFSKFSKAITKETEKAKQDIRDKYAAIEQKKIDDIKARLEGETLETELAALQAKFDLEYELIKDNEELILALKEEYGAKIDSVNKKYDDEELKRKLEVADKINDLAQKGLKFANTINDLFGKNNEKAARRAFNINKTAQLAQASTDGAKGVLSAWSDTPGGPIIKGIAAITAGLSAAAMIKRIKDTKYESSGSSAPISLPSIQSTPMTSAESASPSFNLFGQNNNQNNLSSSSAMEMGGGSMVIKAVVSETDISQTSERLSKIKQMSEN
jgi:hypothetical protein